MELINGRFRLLKIMKHSSITTMYLADDILKSEKVFFNIVRLEYLPQNFNISEIDKKYFIGMRSKYISTILDMGIVKSIDNRKIENTAYFYYVTEHLNKLGGEFADYSDLNKVEKLLYDICKGLGYLHLKGEKYKYLNQDNIMVYYDENNEFRAKLVDVLTCRINDNSIIPVNSDNLIYKAPEVISGQKIERNSDIYSLGMFLKNDILPSVKNFTNLNTFEDSTAITKLTLLTRKMINRDKTKRFQSVKELVESLNEITGKNENFYDIEDVERINLSPKSQGIEMQKDIVVDWSKNNNIGASVAFIHGPTGIGKTAFLKDLEWTLELSEENVHSSYLMEKDDPNEYRPITEIIKKSMFENNRELIKKYENEIKSLLGRNTDGRKATTISLNPEERYKKNSRIFNFICEAISNDKNTVIIDNIQYASKGILELLEMILSKNTLDRNIRLILAYSDEEIWMNEAAQSFIRKFRECESSLQISLDTLNLEEATLLIKDMLNMSYLPLQFSKRIYNHTYGSPLFIQEVIKGLFVKKVIYIDERTGMWTCDVSDYDKIRMPENIKSASRNQLKELNEDELRFLRMISIFEGSIDRFILNKYCGYSDEKIEIIIKNLCDKGIIRNENLSYRTSYIFTNKIIKGLINHEVEKLDKKMFHGKIARILEEKYKEGYSIDIGEMIRHFEYANLFESVIHYSLKFAEELENTNEIQLAVQVIENALRYMENENIKFLEIMLQLAELKNRQGEQEECVEILDEVRKKAEKLNENEVESKALYELTGIYLKLNNKMKYQSCLERLHELWNISKSNEILVMYLIKKVRIQVFKSKERERCSEDLNRAKEFIHITSNKMQGDYYNTLGIYYIITSEIDQGLECLDKAYLCYEKDSYIRGQIHCLNNIAVIWFENYQNNTEALNRFEMSREIAERNKVEDVLPLIYSNLAELYINKNELEKGEEYLNKCKAHFKDSQRSLFLNTELMSLNMEYGLFSEVEKAYEKCKRICSVNEDFGRNEGDYLIGCLRRYLLYGNLEKAEETCSKLESIFEHEDSKLKSSIKFYSCILKLCSGEPEEEIMFELKDIILSLKNNTDRINMYFDFVKQSLMYQFKKSEIVFSIINEIYEENINIATRIKLTVGEAVIFKDNSMENLLKLMDSIKGSKMNIYKLFGNYILAEYHFKRKNYIHSLNHYLIVFENFKKIYQCVPEKYRDRFLERDVIKQALERVREVTVYFTRRKDILFDESMSYIDRVEEVINFDFYKDITNSESFLEYTKKLYKHKELFFIDNMEQIVKNIYMEPEDNLKLISDYLENITLADRCMIIKNSGTDYKVVYSSNGDYSMPEGNIVERVKITRETVLYNKFLDNDKNSIQYDNIKGVICMPIENLDNRDIINIDERRLGNKNTLVNGILYIETYNILNNFSRKSLERCKEFIPLINSMVNSYEFKMISAIDKLTNVYTRKYLMDAFTLELQKAYELGSELSIMIVDLDHFKNINDKFGHQKGDEVLASTAQIMKNTLRNHDIIGRYGGEEFLIVLPNTSVENAVSIAERVRCVLMNSYILGESYPVTASIGVSGYPEHSQLKEELIEKADKALYDAKEDGRNRVKKYTSLMEFQNKVANKLSGIITGNSVEDSRKVLTMIDIMDLVEEDNDFDTKVYNLLGRIIETTEAEEGALFIINKQEIESVYSRRRFSEEWIEKRNFNAEMIKDAIINKKDICTIDWSIRNKGEHLTGIPEWNSIICVPVIRNNLVEAVLLLQVPTSEKEFNYENLNFVKIIMRIAKNIIPCDKKCNQK